VYIWNYSSGELIWEHCFPIQNPITSIVHPPTYLNKILLGFLSGELQLWNYSSQKMIYEIQAIRKYFDHLNIQTPYSISSLCTSPVLDVVGVGLSNGIVVVLNLKFDVILANHSQHKSSVTGVSFSTGLF
jgi:U3 small nucleolar RNA-associated protein 21